jgi:hypothetical protein
MYRIFTIKDSNKIPTNSTKNNDQKNISELIKLVQDYKVVKTDQKFLFIMLFASKFNINNDNLKKLIFDIFKKYSLNKSILTIQELDNLITIKSNSENTYFKLEDDTHKNLETLYNNFEGIPNNMNSLLKQLDIIWDSLILEDIHKLYNTNKTQTILLWQIKFGISNEVLNFIKKIIITENKIILNQDQKNIEDLYDEYEIINDDIIPNK